MNENISISSKAAQNLNNKDLKGYMIIWGGQSISLLGSQIVQFAIIFWLAITTESAIVLALASFVGLVPFVIISPISGVFVDRWSRKKIMIVADSLQAGATFILIVLFMSNIAKPEYVLLILGLRGIFQAF
ncbi:MAG: hypothetical protein HeimC3_05390 [Candidatus Heimdallarchaeota archaeon LC_3]|nr:MAG: hypothetical protein HeimC3_05390 [Candidatus Heimdallarchaeota archaeon LC_3]